jgi:hypothetical protein
LDQSEHVSSSGEVITGRITGATSSGWNDNPTGYYDEDIQITVDGTSYSGLEVFDKVETVRPGND